MLVFAGSTRNNVFPSVQDLVTGLWPTPLVRLEHFGDVWAKLEFFNPLSRSIKDRTVFFLLHRFLNDGLYGGLVEEASSGNVAVALAALANIYGFRYRAYTTKHLPRTTEVLLRVLGAEVVKVDRDSIDEGFWRWVRDNANRDGAINLNQFENADNPEGHYYFTGGEIVEQFMSIGKRPRVLIAGIGTGGHVTGIARRLRDAFGDVYVVGVEPAINNVIPGIKRLESGTRWAREVVDEVIDVSLEEAVDGVIRVARSEGLLIGLSSGAVFQAFLKVRERLGDVTYLLIFPDDIYKYIDIIDRFVNST
ncbi:cysteine synthase [Vulcanisaeta sp. EB80]|uniref:pyridoxal-phosphate dependent enzyme n=1 Tax=Vulcanisaeta sp. EB80 TaxID=1650660 RepID=UPI0009C032B5|nr:pyridoxal-phosphate dependent enzyme [Vulcanisaeta sp. EB80]PLC67729.1 cysteine synthase [Vulcanisaeta sp. EB80]